MRKLRIHDTATERLLEGGLFWDIRFYDYEPHAGVCMRMWAYGHVAREFTTTRKINLFMPDNNTHTGNTGGHMRVGMPESSEVVAYCHDHGYEGWGFAPAKIIRRLHGKWVNPDGSESKTWRSCIHSWWKAHRTVIELHEAELMKIRECKRAEKLRRKAEERKKRWEESHKDYFHAYTDGSCMYDGHTGPGGSAYVILKDGVPIHESSVGKKRTTSNRMEMLAIISVINWLPKHSKVVIFSDSLYAIRVLSGIWQAHMNKDLRNMYDRLSDRMDSIEFQWVKGHSGVEWNEYVDELATSATEKIINGMNQNYARSKLPTN